MKLPNDVDLEKLVEGLDEDWKAHYKTVDSAFLHLWTYMNAAEKRRAVDGAMQ